MEILWLKMTKLILTAKNVIKVRYELVSSLVFILFEAFILLKELRYQVSN